MGGAVAYATDAAAAAAAAASSSSVVHLSFDDGPNAEHGDALLALLAQYNASASFFVVAAHLVDLPAARVRARPADDATDGVPAAAAAAAAAASAGEDEEEARRERIRRRRHLVLQAMRAGHVVGSHTVSHHVFSSHDSQEVIVQQLHGAENILAALSGSRPHVFRAPQGLLPRSPIDVRRLIEQHDYLISEWDIDANDWRPNITARSIIDQLLLDARLQRGASGGRLLFHESTRTIRHVLPWLLPRLLDRGFTFVPFTHHLSLHDTTRLYRLYQCSGGREQRDAAFARNFGPLCRILRAATATAATTTTTTATSVPVGNAGGNARVVAPSTDQQPNADARLEDELATVRARLRAAEMQLQHSPACLVSTMWLCGGLVTLLAVVSLAYRAGLRQARPRIVP